MINQQLINFIDKQLSDGFSKEKITNDLLSNGWRIEDIEEGFGTLVNQEAGVTITNTVIKKHTRLYLLIVSIILIFVAFLIYKSGFYQKIDILKLISSKEIPNSSQELNQDLDIDVKDIVTKEPIADDINSKNNTTNNTMSWDYDLQPVNAIKLIYPKNNDKLASGSKIVVRYELLYPVKFAGINLDFNSCAHIITDKESVGLHNFDCILPQRVGRTDFNIVESYINSNQKAESRKTIVSINLTVSDDLAIKDIRPDIIILGITSMGDGQSYHPTNFEIVYTDNSKKRIMPSELNIIIKDPSIVSIIEEPRDITSLYLESKKIGETEMVVSYKGFEKTIKIISYKSEY